MENKIDLHDLVEAIKNLTSVQEGTLAVDIADTDQNLSLPVIYQSLALPSLAEQVFATSRLDGTTGALFNIRAKSDNSGIELVRKNVEVYPSTPIKSSITQEVIKDIQTQFGIDGVKSIAILLHGLANADENVKLFDFLNTHAVHEADTFSIVTPNANDSFYEITQKVAQSVLSMNMKVRKTFRASVILPFSLASIAMGYQKESKQLASTSTYYVGGTEMQDYYVNPDPLADKVYVILHDKYDDSKSAAVFSPYQNEIVSAIDPESGEHVYFIHNRFALGISPLHTTDKPSIVSFTVV